MTQNRFPKYRKMLEGTDPDEQLRRAGARVVVPWGDGIMFRCPCDERQVYVTSPPHKITFDSEGVLTLDGSCGYRAREDLKRPQNWCHFFIKDGTPEMCSDAQCTGDTRIHSKQSTQSIGVGDREKMMAKSIEAQVGALRKTIEASKSSKRTILEAEKKLKSLRLSCERKIKAVRYRGEKTFYGDSLRAIQGTC